MYNPRDRIVHTTAVVIPVGKHYMERKNSNRRDRSDDPSHHDWGGSSFFDGGGGGRPRQKVHNNLIKKP